MLIDRRLTKIGFAVLLSTSAMLAGPRISIGDPAAGIPVGLDFSFISNPYGGGFFTFTNASGVNWFSLDFQVRERTGTQITCAPGPLFATCDSSMLSSNPGSTLFYVGFDNPTEGGGIPAGSSFTIDLNDLIDGKPNTDPNGRGQWSYPDTFTAMANQTPEPGTLALLAAGFGLLLAGLAYRALRLRSPRPIA